MPKQPKHIPQLGDDTKTGCSVNASTPSASTHVKVNKSSIKHVPSSAALLTIANIERD